MQRLEVSFAIRLLYGSLGVKGLIYFSKKSLHDSNRLAAHHEDYQPYTKSIWYSHAFMLTSCIFF